METPQQNDCATEHALAPKGLVENHVGKPETEWTIDDLIGLVSDCNIQLISLMHIGGDGWLKTLDFVPGSIDHIRDILEGGERADGSSLFPSSGIKPGASDVILRPNLSTAFFDPFSPRPTLALLCRHLGRDGNPLPESPDTILRKADERLKSELSTELQALGEPEYFLGKHADVNDSYGKEDKGYHATSPFVFGQTLRREAMVILADIGVPVKYGHSEVGYVPNTQKDDTIWEQHEVELLLDSLPEAAEAVVLTQWVLRNLAHSKGMRCSFDPVIRRGHAGSGQHYHIAAVRDAGHLFAGANVGDLSPEARWLIGGLVQMGGALMAFGNREKGSFTRLLQGKEAPNAITWGSFNRLALIRLPIQVETDDGRVVTPPTIEFRLPDGSAHPYLVLAGIAQAMLLGRDTEDLETLLERTKVEFALNEMGSAAPVPKSFHEVASALRQFEEPLMQGDVFPESLLSSLGKRLLAERE